MSSGFRPFDAPPEKDQPDEPDPESIEAQANEPIAVDGLLPAGAEMSDDDYADFGHEAARIEELFDDPTFAERDALREKLRPIRSNDARGSVGRAVALGFANVFDPDRVRDDIMVVAERGEGDPDLPETTIDPDDPKATRVVFKRKKQR